MLVKGYRVKPLVKKVASEAMSDNLLGLSAQLAYYFFFSLFPIFLFLTPLRSMEGNGRDTLEVFMRHLASAVPSEAYALLHNTILSVVFSLDAPGLVSVFALLALCAGSNIFGALMNALNAAYD